MSPRCIRAVEYAKQAARRLDSPHLTGAHLVLGLLSLADCGLAANVLKKSGLSLEAVESHIKANNGSTASTFKHAGLSANDSAGDALARAKEEARMCHHTYVGTEHLLLALLAQNDGPTVDLFQSANVDRRRATFIVLREYGFQTPSLVNKLLLLEDSRERVASFRANLEALGSGWELAVWHDAPKMLEEGEEHFDNVRLISLWSVLNPQRGESADSGTGREIAKVVVGYEPLAPVIIHSTDSDAAFSMHNDLRFGGWTVERVSPMGEDWVRKLWLRKARELLRATSGHTQIRRRTDHGSRMDFALDSLEGLAIGDALGEMLAYQHRQAERIIKQQLPPSPWMRTDDSEMAISIVEVLRLYGYIHQDALSRRFAWRFERDPDRGYGKMTRIQMTEIIQGGDWRKAAAGAFSGQGSMGNGGAMRVAPLGAYFWDSTDRVIEEATRSALVTHTHPEGVAGAVAVATAAAEAIRIRKRGSEDPARKIFEAVHGDTPGGAVRDGIKIASKLPADTDIHQVAKILGNGSLITAPDTVPYAIWCAANHLTDYVRGITATITGGGDCDTIRPLSEGLSVRSLDEKESRGRGGMQRSAYPRNLIEEAFARSNGCCAGWLDGLSGKRLNKSRSASHGTAFLSLTICLGFERFAASTVALGPWI